MTELWISPTGELALREQSANREYYYIDIEPVTVWNTIWIPNKKYWNPLFLNWLLVNGYEKIDEWAE